MEDNASPLGCRRRMSTGCCTAYGTGDGGLVPYVGTSNQDAVVVILRIYGRRVRFYFI